MLTTSKQMGQSPQSKVILGKTIIEFKDPPTEMRGKKVWETTIKRARVSNGENLTITKGGEKKKTLIVFDRFKGIVNTQKNKPEIIHNGSIVSVENDNERCGQFKIRLTEIQKI